MKSSIIRVLIPLRREGGIDFPYLLGTGIIPLVPFIVCLYPQSIIFRMVLSLVPFAIRRP